MTKYGLNLAKQIKHISKMYSNAIFSESNSNAEHRGGGAGGIGGGEAIRGDIGVWAGWGYYINTYLQYVFFLVPLNWAELWLVNIFF